MTLNDLCRNSFSVLDGGNRTCSEEQIKCFKTRLETVEYMDIMCLFHGFTTIKAITFSYDIGFIEKIMHNFSYGEIILGAGFLVEKDTKLNELIAEVCANAQEAGKAVRAHKFLADMFAAQNIVLKTPAFLLDHRKIYLLKADDGRTRVITSSANMSPRAWNGSQMEFYTYDDSAYCYDEYEKDFETAWELSEEIPLSVLSSKKENDLIEGNAFLKKIKDTGRTVVLKQPEDPVKTDHIKYCIDHEKLKEDYKTVLKNSQPRQGEGFIELLPRTVEIISRNQRNIRLRETKSDKSANYPAMDIDIDHQQISVSKNIIDLSPDPKEVLADIRILLRIFDNFTRFVGNTEELQGTYYKLMNMVFSSPFHAKLRCAANMKEIDTSCLPLFLLISSTSANCGKTFMISALLKMMTGIKQDPFNAANVRKDDIRVIMERYSGTPVFVDELNNRHMAIFKDIIKNVGDCEENFREKQPLIIFASNDVLEPDEILRKRMVFLRVNGGLPSSIDQNAYKSMGNATIKNIGTGFYREYLRRMLPKIQNELNYILYSDVRPDYYPDLMKLSSDTILSILHEAGVTTPDYMVPLTWNGDYSPQAKYIGDHAIKEIEAMYKSNRSAFEINKNDIVIHMGTDKYSMKKAESWKNTLPPELMPGYTATREGCILTINRDALESRIGYRLGKLSQIFRR